MDGSRGTGCQRPWNFEFDRFAATQTGRDFHDVRRIGIETCRFLRG